MKALAAFVLASLWFLGEATRPVPQRRGAASLLQKTQAVSVHRGAALQQQKEEGRQRGEAAQQARHAKWKPWGCFWTWPFCSEPPAAAPSAGSVASPEEAKEAIEKAVKPKTELKPSDLTDPGKMEDMASHMEGELAAKLTEGVLGSIGVHHQADGKCEVDLVTKAVGKHYDYVCDTTVPWLHYAKDSTWAQAAPPPGTGCHSYVFLTGDSPEGCSVGASCPACGSPSGTVVHTVKIEAGSCKSPC